MNLLTFTKRTTVEEIVAEIFEETDAAIQEARKAIDDGKSEEEIQEAVMAAEEALEDVNASWNGQSSLLGSIL